ncbi:Uncharacterised protein [uncultured archaeon]|nr:Uncharacterised protein [uncultured archaeon]
MEINGFRKINEFTFVSDIQSAQNLGSETGYIQLCRFTMPTKESLVSSFNELTSENICLIDQTLYNHSGAHDIEERALRGKGGKNVLGFKYGYRDKKTFEENPNWTTLPREGINPGTRRIQLPGFMQKIHMEALREIGFKNPQPVKESFMIDESITTGASYLVCPSNIKTEKDFAEALMEEHRKVYIYPRTKYGRTLKEVMNPQFEEEFRNAAQITWNAIALNGQDSLYDFTAIAKKFYFGEFCRLCEENSELVGILSEKAISDAIEKMKNAELN